MREDVDTTHTHVFGYLNTHLGMYSYIYLLLRGGLVLRHLPHIYPLTKGIHKEKTNTLIVLCLSFFNVASAATVLVNARLNNKSPKRG